MEPHSVLQDHKELRVRAVAAIQKIAGIAEEDGSSVTYQNQSVPRAKILRDTSAKLDKNEFILAIVGEFSRGKSSLINALLDDPALLPTSIEPATAAITLLSYAPQRSITVTFHDGSVLENVSQEELSQYVLGHDLDGSAMKAELTQKAIDAHRSGNVEQLAEEVAQTQLTTDGGQRVKTVNLTLPSPFLGDGICLVDTPGIGSVNPEHGEATRGFIHRADAVIFLINTDPVISQSECNFLAFLKDYVNRFLFVVTKIDRFEEEERKQSVEYSARTIEQYAGIPDPPMFPLSARLAVDARRNNDEAKYARSGFPEFLHGLEVFLIRARGQDFIKEHVNLSLTHLGDLRNAAAVELQGLEMNLDDLRSRIETARPALQRAKEKGKQIFKTLQQRKQTIERSLGDAEGVEDMRLYYVLRDQVSSEIDTYDYEHLQHASETIPVFVRDRLHEAMKDRIDEISKWVASLRSDILQASRDLIGGMNQELAAQFEALQLPKQLDLTLGFDPDAFCSNLNRVGTITIGGTLALTAATVFVSGGLGAIVLVGGLLARHTLTQVFRNRAKTQLREALDPTLLELSRHLFANITKAVDENVSEFERQIEGLLESAVDNVEKTLQRLEKQLQSADSTTDRQKQLRGRLKDLEGIESELNLVVGPGW